MRNLVIFTMLLCLLCGTGLVAVADDATPDIAYDGLDISDYQKDVDWEAIARNKRIKYVYIKATEGVTYKSKRYRSYLEQARKHGIKVGSYHFMRTGSSVHDQFENFKSVVKKSEQDLLPLIDIEVHNGWTNQQIRDSLKVFADLIEKHYGCKPMIYTGAYFYNNILGRAFNDYPLFIARYANTPPVINGASWTLWQFSEKGRVEGISTPVDLSCFNKGTSLHSILIKDNHSRSSRHHEATEKKEKTEKEPKAAPKPSKHQEKEDKKKVEKERKAKERAEKLRKEEEEKQRKQAAEQEKKRKHAAEQEKAKREKEQRAAEEKAKREAEKRAAEEKAKLEKERHEAEKRAAEAEKKALEAERRAAEAQKRAQEEERLKAEEEVRKAEAEKAAAEAEKAAAEKKQKELEERAKKQQAQPSKQQQRRQSQRARQQQQRQNQRQKSQQQKNNSNTERTNKSSADND